MNVILHQVDRITAPNDGFFGYFSFRILWLTPIVDDVDTLSPKLTFVHADHLNRPIKMTDGAKASVWDAIRLPFGATHSIMGATEKRRSN